MTARLTVSQAATVGGECAQADMTDHFKLAGGGISDV